MDREAFACLYLNACCLAEHRFLRELQALVDALPLESPPPSATALATAALQFENLDWEALEGTGLGASETPVPSRASSAEDDAERAELSMMCELGPPAVYEAVSCFGPRIERLRARVDEAQLASLLGALPADLPPLPGRLTAEDYEGWCDFLATGPQTLETLIAELRRLDPPI